MTKDEAIECAKNMTYQEAIRNTIYAKGVRYKKATRIKLHELAEIADKIDTAEPSKMFKEFYEQGKYDAEVERTFAEPSGDLISRADVLSLFPNAFYDGLASQIKALPSAEQTIIGIDIPYGSDKGLATVFKGKDDKLILEKVKEICLDDFTDRQTVSIQPKTIVNNCDLISRADAIETINNIKSTDNWQGAVIALLSALPSSEPKGANLINRHDATTVIREECLKCNNLTNADLLGRILALPTSQQTDCTDFIMWLIEIVLDEEDWELNAVGYGEIIARKLKKLGLLEVKDGYYIRHIENNAKESDLVYRPSADRQKGEWIIESAYDTNGEMIYRSHRCSVCGFMNCDNGEFDPPNFCSFCGADMRPEK